MDALPSHLPETGSRSNLCRRNLMDVETLPTRSQTTFGGGPYKNASWRKSVSFETTT